MFDNRKFNQYFQRLFKITEINENMVMNGSFKNKYFASDIDLYNPIYEKHEYWILKRRIEQMRNNYNLIEIKYMLKNGSKIKTIHQHKLDYNDISFIKIDLILFNNVFPFECSIIYDFESETKYDDKKIIKDLLEDLHTKKYNLFKKIKRIKTILKISNFDDDFLNNIVDDIDINVLNMSIHRLKLLKNEKLKQVISQKDYDKFMNIIHEDLRKMKLKTTDDLEDILNKLIKEKINI